MFRMLSARLPALLAAMLLPAVSSHAATIIVNSTNVTVDGNDGLCTLPEAITSANMNVASGAAAGECSAGTAKPEFDDILFDLSGGGPFTISPTSGLPPVSEPVTIDGLSQAGATCATWPPTLMIELSGSLGDGNGLALLPGSSGSRIRGLVINGFLGGSRSAILIDDSDFHQITCCFIGTNIAGTAAIPNSIGIRILGGGNSTIGTDGDGIGDFAEGNLISGNTSYGVLSHEVGATGNRISGNHFGTDQAGSGTIPGTQTGVFLGAGASAHLIGSNLDGISDMAERNVFTAGEAGIVLAPAAGNQNLIRLNSLFDHDLIGIDLGDDGPTPNDATDADSGANDLQNFPVISSATYDDTSDALILLYFVPSSPSHAAYPLAVDFFLADSSGREGQTLVGSDVFSEADYADAQSKQVMLSWMDNIEEGEVIVATATDASGNTSEFGFCTDSFSHGFETWDGPSNICRNVVVAFMGAEPDQED